MKTSNIIIVIIVLAIIGFVVVKFYKQPVSNTPPITDEQTSSIKACYVAHLGKDIYTLSVDSQSGENASGKLSYNNFEKDSSSGSLVGTYKDGILLGDYSFSSEGMDSVRQVIFKKAGDNFVQGFGPVTTSGGKEVFSDLSQVTYDSKSTFVKSADCTETFVDSNNVFSFDYNSFFAANAGDNIPTTSWKLDGKEKGLVLANVYAYRTYMPKTNFSDVHMTVGRSSDANAIKSCIAVAGGEQSAGGTTIGAFPFAKFVLGDAGAGNLYDTTSYRGIVDGDCYAIEYTIHSTNIGNYSLDQGIKQFDKPAIQGEMEKIIKSLKFTINSD